MLFIDAKNVFLIGGAAVAVLAGAYVIWGPSERSRRKRTRRVICPGLVNLGNTCFLNAVLQAFVPCRSVFEWLNSVVESRITSSQLLSTTLRNVVKVLNNDSVEFTEEYCPSDVMQALHQRGWVISAEEQDAHEMFHVLTETVAEEMMPTSRALTLFDVAGLEESRVLPTREAVCRTGVSLHQLDKCSTEHPFHGLLASQLQCKHCGYQCAVKYDSFDSLSLSLPSQQFCVEGLTVETLLNKFVTLESVDDVVCDKCQRSASFIKKLTLGKLPACLCIHIQRTVWLNSGVAVKRFDHVGFAEVLDMSPYVYCKRSAPKLRPKTLDVEPTTRLVGGRDVISGSLRSTTSESRGGRSSSPAVSPVNMLKALNYQSRRGHSNGLYAAQSDTRVDLTPDTFVASHRTPSTHLRTASSALELRMLAAAYSAEDISSLSARRTTYRLTSVVVHLGDVSSGHFVTYRRAPSLNGQRFPCDWLYTSDLCIRHATLSEVLASNAYMLLYEKI